MQFSHLNQGELFSLSGKTTFARKVAISFSQSIFNHELAQFFLENFLHSAQELFPPPPLFGDFPLNSDEEIVLNSKRIEKQL